MDAMGLPGPAVPLTATEVSPTGEEQRRAFLEDSTNGNNAAAAAVDRRDMSNTANEIDENPDAADNVLRKYLLHDDDVPRQIKRIYLYGTNTVGDPWRLDENYFDPRVVSSQMNQQGPGNDNPHVDKVVSSKGTALNNAEF